MYICRSVNVISTFEMTVVATTETLDHAQLIAVLVSHGVEWPLVVEAGRLDDEGVGLPMPDGITEERGEVEFHGGVSSVRT
jgi:hypothetical protein